MIKKTYLSRFTFLGYIIGFLGLYSWETHSWVSRVTFLGISYTVSSCFTFCAEIGNRLILKAIMSYHGQCGEQNLGGGRNYCGYGGGAEGGEGCCFKK